MLLALSDSSSSWQLKFYCHSFVNSMQAKKLNIGSHYRHLVSLSLSQCLEYELDTGDRPKIEGSQVPLPSSDEQVRTSL